MPSKVPLRGLRIDDELYNKICYIGKLNERSFNQQATFFIKQCVEKFEKEHGPIPAPVSNHGESD